MAIVVSVYNGGAPVQMPPIALQRIPKQSPRPAQVPINMFSRRQTCSGVSTCTSGQRRRTRRVSGNGRLAPLVTRLAAKHKMMVSQRRTPLSAISNASRAATSPSPRSLPAPEPPMAPVEYIRDKLPLFQDSMLAGLRDLRITSAIQRSGFLPKELEIVATDYVNAIPPTHMLAVYASKSTPSAPRTKVTLYPAHEIVLSAHCANLPKLPESSCPASIPVVPLALPSPPMFPYLQTYLYTKNISMLENLLLPSSSQPLDIPNLMRRLLAVHGLWGNACALGVIDAPFYSMIERVWASLHQTLSLVQTSA